MKTLAVGYHQDRIPSFNYLRAQNLKKNQEDKEKEKEEVTKNVYAGNAYTGQQDDPLLNALTEQLSQKKKEIDELGQNQEMSVTEKIEKKRELEQEKKDIEQQIMQRQMELQEKQRQQEQKELQKKLEETAAGKTPEQIIQEAEKSRNNSILAATTALNQIAQMKQLHIEAQGNQRVAESELKMAKSYRGGAVASKYQAVANAKVQVNKASQKLSGAIEKAYQAMEDINDSAYVKAEKEAREQKIQDQKDEKKEQEEKQRNTNLESMESGTNTHVNLSL